MTPTPKKAAKKKVQDWQSDIAGTTAARKKSTAVVKAPPGPPLGAERLYIKEEPGTGRVRASGLRLHATTIKYLQVPASILELIDDVATTGSPFNGTILALVQHAITDIRRRRVNLVVTGKPKAGS